MNVLCSFYLKNTICPDFIWPPCIYIYIQTFLFLTLLRGENETTSTMKGGEEGAERFFFSVGEQCEKLGEYRDNYTFPIQFTPQFSSDNFLFLSPIQGRQHLQGEKNTYHSLFPVNGLNKVTVYSLWHIEVQFFDNDYRKKGISTDGIEQIQ